MRDLCFNEDGKQFLSAGYDRYVRLWDTETGACVRRFTNRKVPYCVKFNPSEENKVGVDEVLACVSTSEHNWGA